MVDVIKHIDHWRKGSEEDFNAAADLLHHQRIRHGLFFVHLAIEKLLKAHVCKTTSDLAPRIHNLVQLAEITALQLDQSQIDLLADLNAFNIEVRYPEFYQPQPTLIEAKSYFKRAEELFQWLIKLL